MLNRIGVIVLSLVMVGGCTVVSKKASRVIFYPEYTTQLDGCEKLGPVTGRGSGWKPRISYDSWQGVAEDAKNDMRENAYEQYQADTVVLVNLDRMSTSVVAQGVAYRCY